MTAKVILNPYAGRWKALERKDETISALRNAGIEFDLVQTNAPGEGERFAEQAVQEGYSPIISAGGDGSISEVVNGMMRWRESSPTASLPPLGIIPLGTANDLVVNLKLPVDINSAAQIIATGEPRRIDLGQVNTRYFDNNSAIGLEPTVTIIQQRIKRLRGVLRYIVAALRGIAQNPQWTMQIAWEGGEYNGPATIVSVGNCPLTGGVFYMTPHADPFDGLLTFIYGYIPTRLEILKILPRTMKSGPGSHVEHPSVHEIHSPWIKIHTGQPTPMHADGEIQATAIQDLDYRVVPAALPVLLKTENAPG